MALNNSGPINISGSTSGQSIALELGLAPGTQLNLGNASVRTLAAVPSGAITMPTNFYGKSSTFSFSITTNQQEANLRSLALTAGWNGSSAVIATVNAGVYIWSDSTGTAALTINGSWPSGVTLINNGYIIGKGGAGGAGIAANSNSVKNGAVGGPAISLGVNVTITNNSGAFIAGGGGGGGGSGASTGVGSGGGGGAGGGAGGGNSTTGTAGGAGGGLGAAGSNGNLTSNAGLDSGTGGGGGRILPGTGGVGASSSSRRGLGGGAGGGGAYTVPYYAPGGSGGTGGSAGGTGGNPNNPNSADEGGGAGGGGWGASGGTGSSGAGGTGGSAGAGGKAIALNGFTATTTGAGTTYGAVS